MKIFRFQRISICFKRQSHPKSTNSHIHIPPNSPNSLFRFGGIRECDKSKSSRLATVPILDELYLDIATSSECFSNIVLEAENSWQLGPKRLLLKIQKKKYELETLILKIMTPKNNSLSYQSQPYRTIIVTASGLRGIR